MQYQHMYVTHSSPLFGPPDPCSAYLRLPSQDSFHDPPIVEYGLAAVHLFDVMLQHCPSAYPWLPLVSWMYVQIWLSIGLCIVLLSLFIIRTTLYTPTSACSLDRCSSMCARPTSALEFCSSSFENIAPARSIWVINWASFYRPW